MLDVIHLYADPGGARILTINKRFAFFKASYDIIFGKRVLEFHAKSLWRRHFHCACGHDLYHIYGHSGRKYSLYKNDGQVAWWGKNKVGLFEGDNYKIVTENNEDLNLIIAVCLIIDNHFNNHGGNNSITINFGRIGPEERKFNKSWQPQH